MPRFPQEIRNFFSKNIEKNLTPVGKRPIKKAQGTTLLANKMKTKTKTKTAPGKISTGDITAEKNIRGAWVLSAIVGGYLKHKQYYFCSKASAIADFKAYCNKQPSLSM